MSKKFQACELLVFQKGKSIATIATDGRRYVSQSGRQTWERPSLASSIAFLESQGFSIRTDLSKSF